MHPLERIPSRLLRPLPANATSDAKLRTQIDALGQNLPERLTDLAALLTQLQDSSDYDSAVNWAAGHIWAALERFTESGDPAVRTALLRFARDHLSEAALAHLCRKLIRDGAYCGSVGFSSSRIRSGSGTRDCFTTVQPR
jgi:hypothetical protein